MEDRSSVADVLRKAGLVDDRQVREALAHREAHGGKISEAFVALNHATEQQILEVLSRELSTPLLTETEVGELAVTGDARGSIPRFLAEEELLFPVSLDAERGILTLVTDEPPDEPTLDGVRIFANVDTLRICLTTKAAMRKLVSRYLSQEGGALIPSHLGEAPPPGHGTSGEHPGMKATPHGNGAEELVDPEADVKLELETEPELGATPEIAPGRALDDLVLSPPVGNGDRPRTPPPLGTAWDHEEATSRSKVIPLREEVDVPPLPGAPGPGDGARAAAPAKPAPGGGPGPSERSEILIHDLVRGASSETVPENEAPPGGQFQFLFDLWDIALRMTGPEAGQDRRQARARAELARDIGNELGLPTRIVEEIYFGSYVVDLDPTLERAGYAEEDQRPTLALLARAQCPYALSSFFTAAIPPKSFKELEPDVRVRVASVAAAYLASLPSAGLSVRETLQRLPWAYDVPDFTVALLHALGRRGEVSLPPAEKGSEVVLVDPDGHAAGVLGLRFMADGAPVRIFSDGAAAFHHLREHGAALVVSELDVPGVSGIDLCQAAQQEGDLGPFFFLSHLTDAQMISRALESGAADYFIKPVNVELLVVKARRAIGARASRGG